MSKNDLKMPQLIRDLHELDFDYMDGEGIDFEPYAEFLSPDEITDWLRSWTGNASVDGSDYLVFGQDGTGGLAALWLVRSVTQILEQPVVLFGSEGETHVVAKNFASYLWLLAANIGPWEAMYCKSELRPANAHFTSFASTHAVDAKNSANAIIAAARDKFPNFTEMIDALCE